MVIRLDNSSVRMRLWVVREVDMRLFPDSPIHKKLETRALQSNLYFSKLDKIETSHYLE